MSPADRDEQTQWDERLARSDAGELYGVNNLCDYSDKTFPTTISEFSKFRLLL